MVSKQSIVEWKKNVENQGWNVKSLKVTKVNKKGKKKVIYNSNNIDSLQS